MLVFSIGCVNSHYIYNESPGCEAFRSKLYTVNRTIANIWKRLGVAERERGIRRSEERSGRGLPGRPEGTRSLAAFEVGSFICSTVDCEHSKRQKHVPGPKLIFVTGLVTFVTAVARLACPDLLG